MSKQRASGDQEIRMQDVRKSGYQGKPEAGFEKLWVWQRAYKLMIDIHAYCRRLPRDEGFGLRDQVECSSSSVCDNIAEGYSSYYYKEKIKGFYVARKEAGEMQNHLRKMSGKNYIDLESAQERIREHEEVVRGINGFVRFIREKKGAKK